MKIDLTCPLEVWSSKLPAMVYPVAELTLYNLADQLITSVEVTLIFEDENGTELTRLIDRAHELQGEPAHTFILHVQVPSDVLDTQPSRLEVLVEKVWFEDQSVWRRGKAPLVEYTSNALPRGHERDCLRFVTGDHASGYPEQQGHVWLCVCGRPNAADSHTCVRCRRSRDMVFERFSREAVHKVVENHEHTLREESKAVLSEASRSNASSPISRKRRGHRVVAGIFTAAVMLGITYGAVWHGVPYLHYSAALRQLQAGEWSDAQAAFDAMGTYLDAPQRSLEARYGAALAQMDSASEQELKQIRDNMLALNGFGDSATQALEADYRRASLLESEERLAEARALYLALGTYRDSEACVTRCSYQQALTLLDSGAWNDARAAFLALGDYEDSQQYANEALYRPAVAAIEANAPDEALSWLNGLDSYRDSTALIHHAHYLKAEQLLASGDSLAAGEEFLMAESYEDASERAQACMYTPASTAVSEGRWADAEAILSKISGYLDADALYQRCLVEQAKEAMNTGDYQKAESFLARLPENTEEVQTLRSRNTYLKAVDDLSNGRLEEAEQGFLSLGENAQAQQQLKAVRYARAEALAETGDLASAAGIFRSLGTYSDSAERYTLAQYQLAGQYMEAGDYAAAAGIYISLGDYEDSQERLHAAQYAMAAALLSTGEYATARELFVMLGEYSDARAQVAACDLAAAQALAENGDTTAAIAAYEAIGSDEARARVQALYLSAAEKGKSAAQPGPENTEHTDTPVHTEDQRLSQPEDPATPTDLPLLTETPAPVPASTPLPDDEEKIAPPEAPQSAPNEIESSDLTDVEEPAPQQEAPAVTDAPEQPSTDINAADAADDVQPAPPEEENTAAAEDDEPELSEEELAALSEWQRLVSHAQALADAGQTEQAIAAFVAIGGDGVAEDIVRLRYRLAQELTDSGDIDGAIAQYSLLEGEADAAERILALRYQQAEDLSADGKHAEAAEAFLALGDYLDAADRSGDELYQRAEDLVTAQKSQEAAEAFESLAKSHGYGDAAERARTLWLQLGEDMLASGKPELAVTFYTKAGDQQGVATAQQAVLEQAYKLPALIARNAMRDGKYAAAVSALEDLDLAHAPEPYADLTELYRAASAAQAQLLWQEGRQEEAYPYLQRSRGIAESDSLLATRTDWMVTGTWRSSDHVLILQKDGSAYVDGESHSWILQGYHLTLDAETDYTIAYFKGDQLILSKDNQEALYFTRTAQDALQSVPRITYSIPVQPQ